MNELIKNIKLMRIKNEGKLGILVWPSIIFFVVSLIFFFMGIPPIPLFILFVLVFGISGYLALIAGTENKENRSRY